MWCYCDASAIDATVTMAMDATGFGYAENILVNLNKKINYSS